MYCHSCYTDFYLYQSRGFILVVVLFCVTETCIGLCEGHSAFNQHVTKSE